MFFVVILKYPKLALMSIIKNIEKNIRNIELVLEDGYGYDPNVIVPELNKNLE